MYKPVDTRVHFPKLEEEILAFWEKNDIFKKSIAQREGCEEFVFYDGPPFATGLPHFGHFVPGTIKDIMPRYQATGRFAPLQSCSAFGRSTCPKMLVVRPAQLRFWPCVLHPKSAAILRRSPHGLFCFVFSTAFIDTAVSRRGGFITHARQSWRVFGRIFSFNRFAIRKYGFALSLQTTLQIRANLACP
jgi:hypothetical protein